LEKYSAQLPSTNTYAYSTLALRDTGLNSSSCVYKAWREHSRIAKVIIHALSIFTLDVTKTAHPVLTEQGAEWILELNWCSEEKTLHYPDPKLPRPVFLNRRAAAQYRALASIITGPRLIKKEITRPRSHKGWESLA
jgi:hypothetical protein